jgi:hypothetical protein
MKSITSYIRLLAQTAEWEELKQTYKQALDTLSKDCRAYAINRDGDLFQVSCPVCNNKKVAPAGCGFFVCSRKHVFSVYTEDGVIEITPENEKKLLGQDLVHGEDAHGHNPYTAYKADEKSPFYLSLWMHEDNRDYQENPINLQDISNEAWKLKNKIKALEFMPLDFYAEIDVMRHGDRIAEFGSRLKTWPKYINNMKWFLILRDIDKTEWTIGIIELGER